MSRSFLPKLMVLVAALAVVAFWIISMAAPDTFGKFKLGYVIAALVFIIGLFAMLKAIQQKDIISKKGYMFIAIAFFVGAVFILISSIATWDAKYTLPVMLAAVIIGFILSLFVTGGNKWDEGDNHKSGYKNYYQRKAEEEKQAAKEDK